MLRQLIMMGVLAAFAGASFVPPTETNARHFVEKIGSVAQSIDVSKLRSAASAAESFVANHGSVLATHNQATDLARHVLAAAKTIALRQAESPGITTTYSLAAAEQAVSDPAIKKQLTLVGSAIGSGQVRACMDIQKIHSQELEQDGKKILTPSYGDYLAYCLAHVTADGDRCLQINTDIAIPLRQLCEKQLPRTDHLVAIASLYQSIVALASRIIPS